METPHWSPAAPTVHSDATSSNYECQTLADVDRYLTRLHVERNGSVTMARWILLTDDMDLLLEVRSQIQAALAAVGSGQR